MKALLLSLITILGAFSAVAGEEKAYLGVRIETSDINEPGEVHRVVITDVIDGSSAAKAGLKDQDIIIDVNGTKVMSSKELMELISNYEPGETVRVAVLRDGENKDYEVKLGGRKSPFERRWLYVFDSQGPWLGIDMLDLNDQLAKFFDVDAGVLVEKVSNDSPAETAGIQAGDIITAVNDVAVSNPNELRQALTELNEGDQVQLSAVRKGKKRSFSATLGSWEDTDHHFPGSSVLRINPNTKFKWEGSFPKHLEKLENLPKVEIFSNQFSKGEMEELRKELEQLRKELEEMRSNK